MEAKDWLLLSTLYEQRNITKTAKILYVSQPSLTYRIKQLEKDFGIKIAHRGRRGIEFTPQGELLVKYAMEMLLKLQRTKEALLSMNDQIAGTLKLGAASSLALYMLPRILKNFSSIYPDVEFKLTSNMSSELINLVYKQDVHIGFIRGDFDWSGEKHLLAVENICIVSSRPILLKELPDLPRIVYKTDTSLATVIDNWWKETFPKPPTITMEVDKMETCKEMVIHGLGYGILPTLVLEDSENLYQFQLHTKRGEPILRRSWMVYTIQAMQIPLIKCFVDFVKAAHR